MAAEARRREFESRLARALEMAGDEPAALDTIERAVRTAAPQVAAELLLADNSQAHLARVLTVAPDGVAPGCQVRSPSECVAARRAQTLVFPDSEALDACPRLRDRPHTDGDVGRCSAVCVPVSIMGRTVGVLHTVGEADAPLGDDAVAVLAGVGQPRREPARHAAHHGRVAVPGVDRRPDRAREPAELREPGALDACIGPGVCGRARRPRPLQDPQRHVRSRSRRSSAAHVRGDPPLRDP